MKKYGIAFLVILVLIIMYYFLDIKGLLIGLGLVAAPASKKVLSSLDNQIKRKEKELEEIRKVRKDLDNIDVEEYWKNE